MLRGGGVNALQEEINDLSTKFNQLLDTLNAFNKALEEIYHQSAEDNPDLEDSLMQFKRLKVKINASLNPLNSQEGTQTLEPITALGKPLDDLEMLLEIFQAGFNALLENQSTPSNQHPTQETPKTSQPTSAFSDNTPQVKPLWKYGSNTLQAFQDYMKAKDLGSAGAWLELGKMSAQGIVLYPDNNVAMRCFEKAIELGSVGALVALGKLYNAWSDDDSQILSYGCGEPLSGQEITNAIQPLNDDVSSEDYLKIFKHCKVFQDESISNCKQKAIELFEKAASLGEGRGCFELAELYLFGDREKRTKYYQQAIELLKSQAEKGDGEAYVLMGRVLLMSRGDEVRDEVERLYQKAIDLGCADGYGFLAAMYNLSDHQDRKFHYSKQGAKLGSEEAARGLSVSMNDLRHKGTNNLDDFELAVGQSIELMNRLMECLKWQEFVALRCRHYGLLPHFLKNLSLAKAINSRIGLGQMERYKAFLEPDYDTSDIIDAFVMRPDTFLVQRLADCQNLFDGFIFEASHLRAFATPYNSEFKIVTPDGRVELDI